MGYGVFIRSIRIVISNLIPLCFFKLPTGTCGSGNSAGPKKSTNFKVAPDPQRLARHLAHPQAVLAFYSEVQKTTQSSRTVDFSEPKSPLY